MVTLKLIGCSRIGEDVVGMLPRELTKDESWMLRFMHDESELGIGGVLYVRPDGACTYVLQFEDMFPEEFAYRLSDETRKKSDHMFVVESDGARLNVHAYPREAAAVRMAALSEAIAEGMKNSEESAVEEVAAVEGERP